MGSAPENRADAERLARLGVTHVLDVRMPQDLGVDTTGAPGLYRGLGITYHRTPMPDDGSQKPPATYFDAVSFAREALGNVGTRLYVHCAAGMFRSPSVVYAILRAMGYSQTDAWTTVVAGRNVAQEQYLPGAEMSVPYLPRVVLDQYASRKKLLFALLGFGAAGWAATTYAPKLVKRIERMTA